MKKIISLFLISFLFNSCSNNELTKDEAKEIISQYYHLPYQTKIVIDKSYDNYGWPPEKYRQLENSGFISLTELKSFITRRFAISINEKAREYWIQNGILNQAPEGNQSIIVFKGYEIGVKNVSVSSNAVEKTAEAEVILEISNISPIQQIFSPLESTEIKKTINLKLFDSGWKIVEDEKSKKLFDEISAPQHWAGGWKITFDNTPPDIYSAIVNQDKATFTFPVENKSNWKWGECGGQEYGWEVEVNNFTFGSTLFNAMGAGNSAGSCNLKQLITEKAQSNIFKIGGSGSGEKIFVQGEWIETGPSQTIVQGKILCEVNDSQNSIIISINDKNTINNIFSNKPSICVFKFTDCDKVKKNNVRISYQ